MLSGLWTALALGGIVAGLGSVFALSARVGRESLGLVTSLVGVLLSAWALGRLIDEYQDSSTAIVAIALALGSFAGGYALASAILPQLARSPKARSVSPPSGAKTALLLLSDAEPQTYLPRATALELTALQDDDVLRLGIVTTPFLFAAQKARYRAIGGTSPARRQVREIAEALEIATTELGVARCEVAWCSGPEDLVEQVDALSRAGYSRIVVLPLGVAESLDMLRAKALLDRCRPDAAGLRVGYAAPLGSADAIAEVLAHRLSLGVERPEATGVALLAHGQPEAQAALNAQFDEDEATFVNRVKMLAGDTGLPQEHMRLAWTDWREPDVSETIRHLAALGCTRILICPACHVVDGLSTLLDVQLAVSQARLDVETTSAVTLSTWGDDSAVIESLRTRAAEVLTELDRPAT